MTFKDWQKEAEIFEPAVVLDRTLGKKARHYTRSFAGALGILFLGYHTLIASQPHMLGLSFILFSIWLFFLALDFYYNAHYFVDTNSGAKMSYTTASIILDTDERDVVRGFLTSSFGKRVISRLALSDEFTKKYLASTRTALTSDSLTFPDVDGQLNLREYANVLLGADSALKALFMEQGITSTVVEGAISWVESEETSSQKSLHWWSSEHLASYGGIGEEWSYGGAYLLSRFSKSIQSIAETLGFEGMLLFRKKNLDELEAVLSRSREANALVLAEKGAGGMELVYELWKKMRDGEIVALLHKRMIVFDSNALIAAAKQKAVFEEMLLKVLNDAASAGNIVLVIDDLPSFVVSARALGSDLENLIDPFLAGNQLQVIALTDPTHFHEVIEVSRAFTGRFEKVQVEEADAGSLLAVLQHQAVIIESREKVFFTFQSLLTIVEDARRYFSDDISLDKVIDLLEEVVPHAKQQGTTIITKELVQTVVQNETGIPIGEISKDEREKLLHLESHLHERVIGQDLAITAIANALRRARGGVGNPKRPMGSFLFLGPTGVGKTEAAKALAHIFFGNEDMMVRLDMSEYKGADATDKLIGSFEGGNVGVLSALLRERPYGVLLLDEFEKSSKDVRDLFLQVLDEGFFSDMHGRKVNARNLIIIATSNAASDVIWETVRKGESLATKHDVIIDSIIKSEVFRPELLNRFDDVVLFHPLLDDHLREVARLQLEKFAARLEEKGIVFKTTPELLDYLVKIGSKDTFGGRAMNRALADTIEQIVARKIIEGTAHAGVELTIDPAELEATVSK